MILGVCPFINLINYHGLNTTGSTDGTSMETVFGPSTLLGPKVTFQFPKITNNSSLLWFHSHNMFVSIELIAAGILGLLQIVDKPTQWLTEEFEYGDNSLLLAALDKDLSSDGTQTFANLVTDENRSSFLVINGTSCVNWYSSDSANFVNPLFHETSKNIVKIDILNGSLNWRVLHLGVCDEDGKIKPFYVIQCDEGLINPKEMKMTYLPTASRIAIMIDLNQFKNKSAYLFFYDYDLTEVFESQPAFPDKPNDTTLLAIVPDFTYPNATPYPTPIPDPNEENQQGNYTDLNYPRIPIIPQVSEILQNGSIPIPKKRRMKKFLRITQTSCSSVQDLSRVLSRIRKVVFGDKYQENKELIKTPRFEYDPQINYISYLNRDYFYNIPKTNSNVPTRNIILFPEVNTNAQASGNPYGTTEYVDGANRIMADLWNSEELNLEWALQQYYQNPNAYQPSILPSSKFRIYKTNDEFSNTAMISNDTLNIEFFSQAVAYGDFTQTPVAKVTVIFPPTPACKPLNLQEWIDLINTTFQQTTVDFPSGVVNLSTILTANWSFFPYVLDALTDKTTFIKSAVILTANTSNYWIRFLARWPLLQFFGKPMTGSTLDVSNDLATQLRVKQQKIHEKIHKAKGAEYEYITKLANKLDAKKSSALYVKCNEAEIYGIHDAEIQQLFPFYATSDGDVQLPIACMKRSGELIISPQETYLGLYDGYLNDNLSSFSTKLKSSEIWIYTNGDCADSHSLHFHLTSGFADPHSKYNSPGLLTYKRLNDQLIYSRDIYQIGPQEVVSFYITWPDYSSYEVTDSPNIPCVGGVIHCHFLQHNDANSMIIQYFVE